MPHVDCHQSPRKPWNAGRIIGPKPPLKPKQIWAIRQQLKNANRCRDLAMFNCAIDSKLRGCDLVRLRVSDLAPGGVIRQRATIIQQKTGRPVPFELTEPTREALSTWLARRGDRAVISYSRAVDPWRTCHDAAVRSAPGPLGQSDRP